MRLTALLLFTCSSVAFAADPVASVDFAGGEQGRILVQAKINNQGPFPLIFDTGSINLISLDLVVQLGVKVTGKRTMAAFGGPVETASAVLDSIQLGAVTMGQTEVIVIGGGPFAKGGPVGFLGWEFLSKLVVEVDYEHGRLNFYDPKTYRYTGQGVQLPLTISGNMLAVPAEIFGSNAKIQLDSGSEAPLVLFTKFVREHNLHSKLDAVTGYGFGGLTHAMVMRAPALTIGGFAIKSPIVHLSLDRGGGIESSDLDGNMGGPLLREFTCIYDVPQHSFYLQPNAWFGTQELADRSGLVLDTRGGSAKVLFVYPDSPAAKAGIATGDELTAQNGQPLTDSEWHDLLDKPGGTTVHLTLNHAGRVRSVHFTLKDYIQ